MNLGLALRTQGRLEESIAELRQAAELEPGAEPHFHLGVALKRLGGREEEATSSFRRCLELDPKHAEAEHLLSALRKNGAVPAAASREYVATVFDSAAERYDEHLVGKLGYRGPELLQAAVAAASPPARRNGLILDLGVGTGLCGPWLASLSPERLVGVDLSPEMLAQAEARGMYDELLAADVIESLQDDGLLVRNGEKASLVVAADVLVYLGPLQPLFVAVAQALGRDGLFAFTVEDCEGREEPAPDDADKSDRVPCTRLSQGVPVPSFCPSRASSEEAEACRRDGLVLAPSGRFAHSRRHVRAAAAVGGLAVRSEEKASSRTEGGRRVPGLVYVLGK